MIAVDSARSTRGDIARTYAADVGTTFSVDTSSAAEPKEPPETIRLQPTSGFSRVLAPRELWRYRDLAAQIALRDITVRYRQTAIGGAWAILQPVGFMVPYPLFSLAALVPWTFFSTALLLGSDSLVANAALVSKIYFPRIFIPAGVIVAGFVDLGVSLVILIAIVLIWGLTPSLAILALPLLVAIAATAALGTAAALSAINVRFRDVRYVVPFAIQMWLFATPVVYSSDIIGEPWRTISAINPMVGVVEGFRWATLGSGDAVIFLLGLAYFDRVERGFADYV
jgi:homopolymeric O-antigen transport system permease protein